ncbi:hypothetical protein ADA01nite_28510 [Aneurinibacillus danicus]|uniref:Uncharacterized protein n=1 Tax=Aneurinibacillus danicus TaxID=267746 RepID=A0A511VAQ9_9BACL|nr:hypothetical protein ADA01nite_28510 [Aneurinibacillus danicus]
MVEGFAGFAGADGSGFCAEFGCCGGLDFSGVSDVSLSEMEFKRAVADCAGGLSLKIKFT